MSIALRAVFAIRTLTAIRVFGLGGLALCGLLFLPATSQGHTVFKKFLQTKYKNLQIKCEACHVKGKPKTERNPFGELFHQRLKDQNLTKQWEALKGDEKRKFEKETMIVSFEKALSEVKLLKNDQDKVYADLIAAGEIPNMAVKKEDGEDEDDDDDDGQPNAANFSSRRNLLDGSPNA